MFGYTPKRRIQDHYRITGFISSGTYGRVFKAEGIDGQNEGVYAIKKFKPDKEGEQTYTGISQSAIREMALCAELNDPNVIHHVETILQDKSIYMVFEYCEHDLLQIIHYHSQPPRHAIPASTVKLIMHQLLKGCLHLHQNWVMHRDLKPANIMMTASGQVRIGDLGLARIFREPIVPLYNGDKVVVTIWYRAPELLLGARHYTPAIDLWAVGCIFAELLSLRPIFKGEEAKMDNKKTVPFQKSQMQRIIEVLGMPSTTSWPLLASFPEYPQLAQLHLSMPRGARALGLETWYNQTLKNNQYPPNASPGAEGHNLLASLLEYDPLRRMTAENALKHPYFKDAAGESCFVDAKIEYPKRKISQEDNPASLPGTKRSGLPDDSLVRPAKRLKDV